MNAFLVENVFKMLLALNQIFDKMKHADKLINAELNVPDGKNIMLLVFILPGVGKNGTR